MGKNGKKTNIRWMLVMYDLIIGVVISGILFVLHPSQAEEIELPAALFWAVVCMICIIGFRLIFNVYELVLRYGSIGAYLRMIMSDIFGGIAFLLLIKVLPRFGVTVVLGFTAVILNILACIIVRMLYFEIYREASKTDRIGTICRRLLYVFGRVKSNPDSEIKQANDSEKEPVAIVGAGRVGVSLCQELTNNPNSTYNPVCFIDKDPTKVGRRLLEIPIIYESDNIAEIVKTFGVKTVIIALPDATAVQKSAVYSHFKDADIRVLTYDFPIASDDKSGKMTIRKFTIEELLARKPITLDNDKVNSYYRGKTVMITGGGGSIGSELARQIAEMKPKLLVILDIAENTTYELQQDLKIKYGSKLNLAVEICDITNRPALERVFNKYKPNVVIHAAAHKHVPLMEHNSVECIRNNVFGTLNVVELTQNIEADHFIMVSTDKAVNPTNLMGASKRMCELIVKNAGRVAGNKTKFSATRFGNVLGSAGSVVPLFRKQIAAGGPVTITHKDIIRYFMTIPEASQLVLTSGALAQNGELYVLDMGKPVKIYEMAENMIRLSGLTPGLDIEIKETGLRPGEKLFEELLINGDNQERTENELIFIERDEGISTEALEAALEKLQTAVEAGDDEKIKDVMAEAVTTYKRKKK